MQNKFNRRIIRSISPGMVNKEFHKNMKSPKFPSNKSNKSDRNLLFFTARHADHKIQRNLSISRSLQNLPPIPGNDLNTIKYIFEKARKYRDRMSQQRIPVKLMKRK